MEDQQRDSNITESTMDVLEQLALIYANDDGKITPQTMETIPRRFLELEPRGGIETMLVAQMLATHDAAMVCLRLARRENQSIEGRQIFFKHSEKFMALFGRQVAALDKHRGHAQQNVTVKHVHIAEGGQAIVGNVAGGFGGGGGRAKQAAMLEEAHDTVMSQDAKDPPVAQPVLRGQTLAEGRKPTGRRRQ